MKRLKAYQVSDGNDQTVIRFATNNATARREGANEMEVDWTEVDYCNRASQYDELAPGPVPPLVMIENGWWFECSCCGQSVNEYNEDRVASGQDVYCDETCRQRDHVDDQARVAAHSALIEVFEARFPGSTALRAIANLDERKALESGTQFGVGRYQCGGSSVSFTFPGSLDSAYWVFGDEDVTVSRRDLPAWCAYRGKPIPPEYQPAPTSA